METPGSAASLLILDWDKEGKSRREHGTRKMDTYGGSPAFGG
jgi:hypothetical protein